MGNGTAFLQGLLGSVGPAFAGGVNSYYSAKDKAAAMAAEAADRRQRQANWEADQAQKLAMHGEDIDTKLMTAGLKSAVEARHPATPEESSRVSEFNETASSMNQAQLEAEQERAEANVLNMAPRKEEIRRLTEIKGSPDATKYANDPVLGFERTIDPSPEAVAPPYQFAERGVKPVEQVALPSVSERGLHLGEGAAEATDIKTAAAKAKEDARSSLEAKKAAWRDESQTKLHNMDNVNKLKVARIAAVAPNRLADMKEQDAALLDNFALQFTDTDEQGNVIRPLVDADGRPQRHLALGLIGAWKGMQINAARPAATGNDLGSKITLEEFKSTADQIEKQRPMTAIPGKMGKKAEETIGTLEGKKQEIVGAIPKKTGTPTVPRSTPTLPGGARRGTPVDAELEEYRRATGNPNLTRAELDAELGR